VDAVLALCVDREIAELFVAVFGADRQPVAGKGHHGEPSIHHDVCRLSGSGRLLLLVALVHALEYGTVCAQLKLAPIPGTGIGAREARSGDVVLIRVIDRVRSGRDGIAGPIVVAGHIAELDPLTLGRLPPAEHAAT